MLLKNIELNEIQNLKSMLHCPAVFLLSQYIYHEEEMHL